MEQPHQQERPESQEQEYVLNRCSFHPDVETGLACGRCGKYICPRCMIQTPVGSRCPECARVTKLPTFDVTPNYLARAAVAGGVVAVVGGVIWGFLLGVNIPFLPWLSSLAAGYAVGETVSIASNRKRGTTLAVIAGLCMVIAVIASNLTSGTLLLNDIFGLLFLLGAFYMAVSRVR